MQAITTASITIDKNDNTENPIYNAAVLQEQETFQVVLQEQETFQNIQRLLFSQQRKTTPSNIDRIKTIPPPCIHEQLKKDYPNHAVLCQKLYQSYKRFADTYTAVYKQIGDEKLNLISSRMEIDIPVYVQAYMYSLTNAHMLVHSKIFPLNNPEIIQKELIFLGKIFQHKTRILREKYLICPKTQKKS